MNYYRLECAVWRIFPIFRNDMFAIMNSRAIMFYYSIFFCARSFLELPNTIHLWDARCTRFTFNRKKYRIKYWNYNVAMKNVFSKWIGIKSADLRRFLLFTLAAVSILFYAVVVILRIEFRINHQVVGVVAKCERWKSEAVAHARA